MMSWSRAAIAACLTVAAAASGCVDLKKTYPEKRSFVLDVGAPPQEAPSKGALVLKINKFRVSPLFAGRAMVYRIADLQYESDFYDEWFVAPAALITQQAQRWLSASRGIQLVLLGLDHVDLYQIHGFDPATPIEETVRALDDVVRSGKARYVGFSNLSAWLAMKAIGYAEANGLARFQSAQVYYSIAGRDIEREIAPMAQSEGVAVLPWSPLAGGLLSGKFDPSKSGPEGARRSSFDFPPVDRDRLPRVLSALREVAGASGNSVARVALGWQLTRPFVTSVIIGAKTREQLLDNLAAADLELAPEQVRQLDEASALPNEYPGWMLAWQNRDPRGVVSQA